MFRTVVSEPENRLSSRSEIREMDKFIGFFRNISILLFTGTLIWSYAYMAGQSDYSYEFQGISLPAGDENTFFFAGIMAFLIANLVCNWFAKTLKKITTSENGKGLRNRSLKLDLITWTKGFAGVLNLFFALVLVFLALMKMSTQYNIKTLGFYVYLGPVLLVAWFVYLAVILIKRRA